MLFALGVLLPFVPPFVCDSLVPVVPFAAGSSAGAT